MKKLIGLSVSFCVKDICQGKIPLEAVQGIVPGFSFDNKEAVFERYKDIYWRAFPEQARRVLDALTIMPPHVGGQNIAAGYWMKAEDYRPDMPLNYDHARHIGLPQDQYLSNELKMNTEEAASYVR